MNSTTLENIMNNVNYCDGSLRDIYVNDVDLDDWNKMIIFVTNKYKVSNSLNKKMPIDISTIISIVKNSSFIMKIKVSEEITINCNFFISENSYSQIELDYDPKEVQTDLSFQKIVEFIEDLGNVLNKKVLVTPENCADIIMLEYNPKNGQTIYFNDSRERFLVRNK